ncbi:hypothetical protein D623_10031394 [Myotis brandtii]|uniref:Uncharacterized protein n=1 Tax=Myotis brandtii TaxID=109478 RepID=S7MRL3_MYOBR|nr:hypothetical protein D623_10031394 [Myotis brandtii]
MAHAASQLKKNRDLEINAEEETEKKKKHRKRSRDRKKKSLAEPGDVQQFLQQQRRPAALVPGPLFDLEANRTGVRQAEFLDSTELKQMLCGPKCFVRSTTESA